MKKLIGLRVYCAVFGAGEIQSYRDKDDFPIIVKFDSGERVSCTDDGRVLNRANPTLSTTPYTLENGGFKPLSDLNKPKVGDWGYFWNNTEESFGVCFSKIYRFLQDEHYIFEDIFGFEWQNFSHTPPEFIKDKIIQSCK